MSVVKQPPDCLGYNSHPLLQHRCEKDILVNFYLVSLIKSMFKQFFLYTWSHVLETVTSSLLS